MGMTISAEQVRAVLGEALSPGDDVFIHAALGRLGHFDAGIDDLIAALLEAVAPDGNVIMMTDTRSFSKTGRFSLQQPSETGLLTERFRLTEGARRSNVPMVSFAAIGPEAEYYTRPYNSHLDDSATINRLLQQDGKIMLMGVGYEKCTLYHLSEERRGSPYNFYKRFEGEAVGEDGEAPIPISQRYFVRRDMSVKKDPSIAGRMLEDRGLAHIAPLGDGVIRTFKARDFDACCMEALDRDADAFLARDQAVAK